MIYFHNASGIWSGNSELLRLSLALRATVRSCCCSKHTLEKAPPRRVHAVILSLGIKAWNAARSLVSGRDYSEDGLMSMAIVHALQCRQCAVRLLRNLAEHPQKISPHHFPDPFL